MDFEITDEIITIKPKTTYLSATEMIAQRNVKYEAFSAGLRKVHPQNTEEEAKELAKLYDQLEKQLSVPRIARLDGRAVGYWDDECEAVCILRKDGKFDQFGYSYKGRCYLTYYEALFLLELNRLQLEYKSLNVSVEQAYLLLLGEQQSHKFIIYLLYSYLSRAGYLLRKYENIHFNKSDKIANLEDCIWATLKAKLANSEAPEHVRKSSYYNSIQQQFDVNTKAIRDAHMNSPQSSIHSDDEQIRKEECKFFYQLKPNCKRSASASCSNITANWQNAKRGCWSPLSDRSDRSLVDVLRDDPVYQKFKDTFAKFDIIPLTRYESDDDVNSGPVFSNDNYKLEIEFDLYLRSDGFNKTAIRPPNFRIVILKGNIFPTHREIYQLHRQQVHPVPLLIVTFSESKQLQAYLYYFS